MLTDFPLLPNSDKPDSGVFDEMQLCYGYHLTVKGTGVEVPDKAYETGKLQYGNANPDDKDYSSLTDICYGEGGVEIRIPWQLLNVMDPSSKQQMSDFYQNRVIMPQNYEEFSFGFGVANANKTQSISLSGSYGNEEWNMPTWHERLKPAYYQLQKYLAQYQNKKSGNNTIQ